MPPRDYEEATVVVIELEGGQVYFKMIEPKPEPQRVEKLLRLTIDAWFNARPQFVIDRTHPVGEGGETLGIQVWFHCEFDERLPQSYSASSSDNPIPLTIEVSETILRQLPKEHLEAVVEEAVQLWHSQPHQQGTLMVINTRRIAVILDDWVSGGAVVPVEAVFPVLDEMARGTLQKWLESLKTRLYVIKITGSWFEPHVVGWQKGRIVEPRFLRTNMTYDTGKPPES